MNDTTKIYRGKLEYRTYGEHDDALFIVDDDEPLAAMLEEDRDEHGPYATVRYFVSEVEQAPEQLKENLIRQLVGSVDAEYTSHYSDITGYLWTDEELNVGGHDLMAELRTYVGRWLHLEVRWSTEPAQEQR